MRTFLKWLLRGGVVLLVLIVLLAAPVAYVELACKGSRAARPYTALLAQEHHRPESRTLMTYPEWHIVHAYEDYGEVIRTGAPHDFGYLRAIGGFWSSLCALSEASSAHGAINTETKQMVYVIGVSFTAELMFKALYEETVGRLFVWLRGSDRAPLDDVSAKQAAAYADFLQQVPWYKWRFAEDADELDAKATEAWRDRERRLALGLEYAAKGAYAKLIEQAVASAGGDELTLRMVVAGTPSITGMDAVKVIDSRPEGTVIETPRYRALTKLLNKMAVDGLDFVEIAGNDDIMFTVTSPDTSHPRALASMARQGFGDYRHLVTVPVKDLASALRSLRKRGGQLEHIHDY